MSDVSACVFRYRTASSRAFASRQRVSVTVLRRFACRAALQRDLLVTLRSKGPALTSPCPRYQHVIVSLLALAALWARVDRKNACCEVAVNAASDVVVLTWTVSAAVAIACVERAHHAGALSACRRRRGGRKSCGRPCCGRARGCARGGRLSRGCACGRACCGCTRGRGGRECCW